MIIVSLSVGITTVRDATSGVMLHDCRLGQDGPLVANMAQILRDADLLP